MIARTARTTLSLLGICIASSIATGCGGSGAALQISQYPGDRDASPRRLESLARTFENTYGCTETDTIQITGMSPGLYAVSGCNAMRDYMLTCHYGGYGGSQVCNWAALPDLAQQASAEMNCQPAYLEMTPAGPNQRIVEGCGFRAGYMLVCAGGGCAWQLAGRIEQVAQTTSGAAYVQ